MINSSVNSMAVLRSLNEASKSCNMNLDGAGSAIIGSGGLMDYELNWYLNTTCSDIHFFSPTSRRPFTSIWPIDFGLSWNNEIFNVFIYKIT